MSDEISVAPDVSALEIVTDAWTEPFWQAAGEGRLVAPRCEACDRFRWPPGPFCPHCRSQATVWVDPGTPRLYSFTIVRRQDAEGVRVQVPALIEFPQSDGIRIVAAIVGAPVGALRIGLDLQVSWQEALGGNVPVFNLPPGT